MTDRTIDLPRGDAICYSGYREGQSPATRIYPSEAEIREDLHLLAPHFQLLRLYDCSPHAERVLHVIEADRLPLRVLLGAHMGAEASNPGCPWGAQYADAQLAEQRAENDAELGRLVALAAHHPHTVFAVAVGNEALVDWTDHLVPLPRMLEAVRFVKRHVRQPVTVCENHVPWRGALQPLAAELDFLSVHSYAVWEGRPVAEALAHTQADLAAVTAANPGKPLVLSEVGWCTAANGRGFPAHHASTEAQATYLAQLRAWSRDSGVPCFLFEAFDEPWKGSSDPLEPEKHWGLFGVDRQAKPALRAWAEA
jgi:exo-beta-1,3-glucanase (GH17 family)